MKGILLTVVALLISVSSWADIANIADETFTFHVDSMSTLQEISQFTNQEQGTPQGSLATTQGSQPIAQGTYKNWLGETCLDLGNDNKNMYYNWKRDVTYVGIPLFLSSFVIKTQKKAFRSARFSMNENWKTEIDNYTQFSPYALVVGLKAFGYKGRSSWDRMLTSAVLSNVVMAVAVNSTKYSVKEMRPDNSSANSFPSGHTATAFTAATVLHKEYGLTRSPWFSVGGYTVAMGTGFMRVLNNRHWISDVVAGAGIGILSTELGYFLGDLLYKNKGITHLELSDYINPNHPSFFDIQMGVGLHKGKMDITYDSGEEDSFELGTSTAVGVEGAYFINKYLGFGGMARVTTTPTKGLEITGEDRETIEFLNQMLIDQDMPCVNHLDMANSNFIDGSLDAGIYGNLPLSKRFSIGAKFLCGVRFNGGYDVKAQTGYRTLAKDANNNHIVTGSIPYDNPTILLNPSDIYVFQNTDGSLFNSNETLMPGVTSNYNYYLDPDKFKSDEYSISKLTGGSSFNYVLGISATYHYKENFAWKIFLDFDSAKSRYNYSFNFLNQETEDYISKNLASDPDTQEEIMSIAKVLHFKDSFKSRLNLFTIGGSFSINF